MSDLENLEALKRLLEKKDEDEKKNAFEKEKRFIKDATRAYLGEDSSKTTIQVYTPKDMIAFLEEPITEVQQKMGGEWAEMDKISFEAFTFTIKQKIKKSASLVDWQS